MKHFLLVYSRRLGTVLREEVFVEGERALDRRFELEQEYRNDSDVEIVVLTALSREALLITHGRYFRTLSELVDNG